VSETTPSSLAQPNSQALALTALCSAIGIALCVVFPLLTTVLMPLAAAAPLGWFWVEKQRLPQHPPSAVIVLLALIVLYLAINASWSLSRSDAYRSVLLLIIVVLVLHLALRTLPEIGTRPRWAMGAGLLAGLFLGAVFIAVEIWDQQALRRAVMSAFPALRPDPRHWEVVGDQMTHLEPHLLNRNITVMVLLFWPAAGIITRLRSRGRWRWLLFGCLAAIVAAVAGSVHATSKIALIGSAATFGAFHRAPLLVRRLIAIGFAAATLFVVPLCLLGYAYDLCAASWLPQSARHRIVIWGTTAGEVAKAPLLGAGVANARALKHVWGEPREPCIEIPVSTGLHSHNAYLQVWYEAGAVGALLLLALGLLVLRALATFSAELQPYLHATFAACALMAASAFSIWQPWFVGALALSALAAALLTELPKPPTGDVA
jgi:O-antigen ligase